MPGWDEHKSHDIRRGPTVCPCGETYFVCLDCRVFGSCFRYEEIRDRPELTEGERVAHQEWMDPDVHND